MPENNTEGTRQLRKKPISFKKKVGLAGMAAISLVGGVDRAARAASTVDNTPTTATATRTVTPLPTATSTPTDTDRKITAMQTVVAEAHKQVILRDLEAEAAALAKTPTATPNPVDVEATRTARQDEAYGKERARLEDEYNKTHPTAAPLGPTPTPAPVMKAGTGGDEGGFPWGTLAVGVAIGAGALEGFRRFGGRIRGGAAALVGGGITRVRNMLPHGGGPAAPGP